MTAETEVSPDIIVSFQYNTGGGLDWLGVVDYTKRSEAVDMANEYSVIQTTALKEQEDILQEVSELPGIVEEFERFMDYTKRNQATVSEEQDKTPLFSENTFHLSEWQVRDLKRKLKTAQENQSILWQGAVSFDTDFLVRSGLLVADKELERKIAGASNKKEIAALGRQRKVNQQAIKEAVMKEIQPFFKLEKLSNDAFWWGSIHFNTKHVHVHVTFSEEQSIRPKVFNTETNRLEPKGNLKVRNMNLLKSRIYHRLLSEQEKQQKVEKELLVGQLNTSLLKESLVHASRYLTPSVEDVSLSVSQARFYLEQAYRYLPKNKPWRYGSNASDFKLAKQFLTRYVDHVLATDQHEAYQAFKQAQLSLLSDYQTTYQKNFNPTQALKKRELAFKERMGNKLLSFLKEHPPGELTSDTLYLLYEENVSQFSKGNQQKLKDRLPNVYHVKSESAWKRDGLRPKEEESPIKILEPVYQLNAAGEPTTQIKTFRSVERFDISQMELDPEEKKPLRVQELLLLNRQELTAMIELLKNDSLGLEESERTRELGLYRYGLKLKELTLERVQLLAVEKNLQQFQQAAIEPEAISWYLRSNSEQLALNELKQTPKWQCSTKDKQRQAALEETYADSRKTDIDQVTTPFYLKQEKRIFEEQAVIKRVRNIEVLSAVYGETATKEAVLEKLDTDLRVFQLKHTICKNNDQLKQSTDELEQKKLKQASGRCFAELKAIYAKDENNEWLDQVLSYQRKRATDVEKIYNRQQAKQKESYVSMPKAYLNQLGRALKASNKKDMNAMMKKIRDDDRVQQEEAQEEQQGRGIQP